MLAELTRLPVDWSDLTSDPRKSALPARYIYETVLPEIVDRLGNGDVYYHRSSPYSIPGKSSMDLKYGDLHNCEWLCFLLSLPVLVIASSGWVAGSTSVLTDTFQPHGSDMIQGTSGTALRNRGRNGT